MVSTIKPLDWNDVRFFLAVAREGTLARAAAALRVDQTTVGRRIASLEAKLRVALFKRAASGFQVSVAGARVLAAAEQMEEAAIELASGAAGEDASSSGTVRIATTESLAEAFVIPAVRNVRLSHPGVHVVITTAWGCVDLRKGEADLAVRLVRPTDPRLASRKLADFSMRLYASRDYVAERGLPKTLDGHALLAYEDAVLTTTRHPFANLPMDRGELVLLSNSHRVLLAGASRGLGVVQLPSYVGDVHPELVRVFPDVLEAYAVWLVLPQANRRIASVRAVTEAIVATFHAHRSPTSMPTRARSRGRADRSPKTSPRRP